MSTDENKAVVQRFIEAYNTRDSAALSEVLTPDAAKRYIEDYIPGNSLRWADERVEITEMVAEGDRVWARTTHSGRHVGEYMGLPPTGKNKTTRGAMFFRIAGGTIVEHSAVWDRLDEVKQIGGKIVPGAG